MKSSFSWPGRPPAEMISRNVERLLTSILDGRPKRGAFCTSTLDGTPKRGAFCTSTLDGRLKRDAFLCPRIGAYCIRPTFLTIKINGTQIRSTKRSRKGTGSAKGDQTCDSLSPTGPFGGAYLSTPYHATSKRDAFRTSYLLGTLKRGAFCTSYLVATPKRGAFYTSYLLATLKRGAFWTSYLVATLKRGAFCTSYLVATPKRGAFCTSYLVGSLKRDAFCLFYSSFLALMQEKKQKKIKASGMPAKFSGYIIGEVGICVTYQANSPASAEAASQVGRVHYRKGKDR